MDFLKSKTFAILVLALIISGFLHGWNMFNYPYFENDEGTYFAQSYAVAYEGKITNYTYWYDHVPFGWILTAAWMRATGGPFVLGYSLHSARAFMLLVHLIESVLIFAIVKKITKRDIFSFFAVLAFSLSPLAVYFQRRLLLDNLMTMWLLASVVLILYSKKKLGWILLSGISFAIAVLTKENAIFAFPAFAYLVYLTLNKRQRLMGIVNFSFPTLVGVLYFVLFALLKGELFPSPDKVSLIETWTYQLSRGTGLPFYSQGSDFMVAFLDWFGKDPYLLIFMIASTFWIMLIPRKRIEKALGLVGVLFWLFLIRGGLVINFYIVPLIAFGVITGVLVLHDLERIKGLGVLTTVLLLILWVSNINPKPWIVDEATPQRAAVEWIKENLSPSAVLAVDNAQLLDLQLARRQGDPAFKNAHWFWKLEKDPQIRNQVISGDWANIDYTILSHDQLRQTKMNTLPFLEPIIPHSVGLRNWGPVSSGTYLNIPQKISTNGDWVAVYKTKDPVDIILQGSWVHYKVNFITSEGRVVDPQRNITTSEGQSYAILRAVIADDKGTFDLVWNWTNSRLQSRIQDNLFSWKWVEGEGVVDSDSATDADIDIATALILASRKWDEPAYQEEAKEIINDIWRQEVVELGNGMHYLLAGTWAGYGDVITVNPSYISPASFRLFAEIDNSRNWEALASDSYVLLNELRNAYTLAPDWVGVDKETQQIVSVPDQNLSNNFSYDAARIYWRIALDYSWFESEDAKEFLENDDFFVDRLNEDGKIYTTYSSQGEVLTNEENNVFYGMLLPYFNFKNNESYSIIRDKLQKDYNGEAWEEYNNYYTQNWVWLGLSLSEGRMNYEK